jgi:hypothetical protein
VSHDEGNSDRVPSLMRQGEIYEAIGVAMAPYDYDRDDVPDDPE